MSMEEKPAIFVFTTSYDPFLSGAEIAIQEVSRRLAGKFRFFIFTARFRRDLPSREERTEGTIIRVGFGMDFDKFLLPFFGTLIALRLIRRVKPALFWPVMVTYAGGIPYIVNSIRFWRRTPIVQTLQEGDSEAHIRAARLGFIGLAWRLALARADFLTAISSYLEILGRRFGYRGSVAVIPNGVDVRRFEHAYPMLEKEALRRELGIDPAERVIITTSRLNEKNAVDTLILAFHELVRTRPDLEAKLLIVGDGAEQEELRKLSREVGILERIIFTGYVTPADIPRYLSIADVFCRPSRSEGLGNSFLEAMAAGVPVVATSVGGIPDFLRDGENGLFCRVDDPKDCAKKIFSLLTDQKLRERIVTRGRETVRADYQWDAIARKFDDVFEDLIRTSTHVRVLIATGIFPPDIGGPASYSIFLRDELMRRGYRVDVVTYGPAGISRKIPKGLRHTVYFAVCVLRAFRVDVIFAQDPVSAGLPALLAAKLTGRTFAIRVAGDYAWEQAAQRFGVLDSVDDFQNRSYDWRTEFLRGVQRFVINRGTIVITPSEYFRAVVSGWLTHPERVHAVYNGLALSQGECPPGKTESAHTVFSAGRLVPWKGFLALVDVAAGLPDWQLIIAGDGPDRPVIEKYIRERGVEKRVTLTGALSQAELTRELCRASIFILNTSFESFSFQVVAAMHAGVPVITTRIGNLPEIIENGVHGILVAPNDVRAIIAAVKKFSTDTHFRGTIVKNARARAEDFSIEKTASRLLDLFSGIAR